VIKWGASQFLPLLLVIPFLAAAWLILALRKKTTMKKVADAETLPRLTENVSRDLRILKAVLFILGLTLLITSLARPRWGEKLQIYKGRGIDIVVCLDASKSMLAQDIKPSRLERAKSDVSYLLDNLNTHQVGITAFAGDCYVMCPLTTDVEAAKLFLDIIDPGTIPRPGTNLERAVAVSSSLFNPKEESYKALILITDGDNLEGDPMPAVESARSMGIRIFTVGAGTLEGAAIPEPDNATGGVNYKKGRDQKIVVSRLADRLLLLIAKATDGRYYRTEGLYVNRLVDELDKMKKKEIAGGAYVEFEERYQYFLIPAFILLLLSVALSDRKGPWFRDDAFAFIKRLRFFMLLIIFAPIILHADVGSTMRQGNALVRKGAYEDALKKYQEALVQEPDNTKIHYNIARTLYKMDKYAEAASAYQLCLLTKERKMQAQAFYNIGNCQFKQGQLDAAINSYSNSLLLNPKDRDAKQNLEFCRKIKEQMKNQPQSDSTNQNQQKQQTPRPQPQAQPQPKPGEIGKEDANRILQALQNKEKENMKNRQEKVEKEKVEKDW
jgi:Ca-activated chloride channel family protein